jgi:hypothetical protein
MSRITFAYLPCVAIMPRFAVRGSRFAVRGSRFAVRGIAIRENPGDGGEPYIFPWCHQKVALTSWSVLALDTLFVTFDT